MISVLAAPLLLAVCASAQTSSAPVKMDTVLVTGSEESGYITKDVSSVGPWKGMPLQDTPYSIHVLSSDFLDNVGAITTDDVFKYSPYSSVYIQSSRFANNINLRGIYSSLRLVDGMRTFGSYLPIEDKESAEVMVGATGFMYGMTGASGAVNFASKRPTATPTASLTLHNAGGFGGLYAHYDMGGPITADRTLGYRINIVEQDGCTFLDEQNINKRLFSGAFDWHVSNSLVLQFDLSNYYDLSKGMQVAFAPDSGKYSTTSLAGLDTSKLWGQRWGFERDKYTTGDVKARLDITEHLSLRVAARYTESNSERLNVNSTGITNFHSSYKETYYQISDSPNYTYNTYAYLDAKFSTGEFKHLLTTGLSWDHVDAKAHPDRTASGNIPGTFSFSSPVYVDKPSYTVGTQGYVDYNKYRYGNLVFGDQISWKDSVTLLLGANRALIDTKGFNVTTGAVSSAYKKNKTTPTASLIYKPIPAVSLYASYLQSLEQGGTAPGTYNGHVVGNSGAILAPLTSKQYEIGAKTTLGGTLFTAALFELDKANQYVDPADYVYKQDGLAVYKGVEFTATGKLLKDLTIVSGITIMDARTKRYAINTALEGKVPTGMSENLGKVYLEYAVPGVTGLYLTGGVFYTGSVWMDAANTDAVPSAVTYDLGFRIQTKIAGKGLVLRFNVANLTDKTYWLPYGYVSDPRIFTVSTQLRF